MRVTRRRDTAAEVAVRRLLHARGLRYRVDLKILPGGRRRADVAFVTAKVAVFVDGCFWHSCPLHRTRAKANATWWATKLGDNRRRDTDTNRRLIAAGWHVVRIWEHEAPLMAANRISNVVRARLRYRRRKKRDRASS